MAPTSQVRSLFWQASTGTFKLVELLIFAPSNSLFYKRAAEAIFDSQSSDRPKMEQMQVDDSTQGLPPPTHINVCAL